MYTCWIIVNKWYFNFIVLMTGDVIKHQVLIKLLFPISLIVLFYKECLSTVLINKSAILAHHNKSSLTFQKRIFEEYKNCISMGYGGFITKNIYG